MLFGITKDRTKLQFYNLRVILIVYYINQSMYPKILDH